MLKTNKLIHRTNQNLRLYHPFGWVLSCFLIFWAGPKIAATALRFGLATDRSTLRKALETDMSWLDTSCASTFRGPGKIMTAKLGLLENLQVINKHPTIPIPIASMGLAYLPRFGWFLWVNVWKYTIHGWYGQAQIPLLEGVLRYNKSYIPQNHQPDPPMEGCEPVQLVRRPQNDAWGVRILRANRNLVGGFNPSEKY